MESNAGSDLLKRWVFVVTAVAFILSFSVFVCGDLAFGQGSLIGTASFLLLIAGPPTSLVLATISFLMKRYALCATALLAIPLCFIGLFAAADAMWRGLSPMF